MMIRAIHLRNPSICGHASRCGSVAQNESAANEPRRKRAQPRQVSTVDFHVGRSAARRHSTFTS